MGAICFTVPGEPRGKGRPRFGRGHTYTDAKTVSFENLIGWTASQAMNGQEPFSGPVCVTIAARFAPPVSASRKVRTAMLGGEIIPTRVDADNLGKLVCDGLNRVAYVDDRQVASLLIRKFYAETPGLDVVIRAHVPEGVMA